MCVCVGGGGGGVIEAGGDVRRKGLGAIRGQLAAWFDCRPLAVTPCALRQHVCRALADACPPPTPQNPALNPLQPWQWRRSEGRARRCSQLTYTQHISG